MEVSDASKSQHLIESLFNTAIIVLISNLFFLLNYSLVSAWPSCTSELLKVITKIVLISNFVNILLFEVSLFFNLPLHHIYIFVILLSKGTHNEHRQKTKENRTKEKNNKNEEDKSMWRRYLSLWQNSHLKWIAILYYKNKQFEIQLGHWWEPTQLQKNYFMLY